MTVAEALPYVNVLLVPTVLLLMRITNQLASLSATQKAHHDRLERLESDVMHLVRG